MQQRTMQRLDWAMLLGLTLVFGSSYFFGDLGLKSFGPLTVAAGRVSTAAIVLTTVALLRGRRFPAEPKTWMALLVMGAINNAIPFSLIFWGQTRIDSGLASILNAATPIFTVVLAHLVGDERLTPRRGAGVVFGFAGVAVLIGPGSLSHLDPTNIGEIAVLGAALCYALSGLWGRRFRGLPVEIAAGGMLICSSAIMLPLAMITEHPWTVTPSAISLAGIAALGLLSTSIAYLLYFKLLARVGATNLLLVTFLLPIVALFLGAMFLGEHVQPIDLLGLVLILGGLTVIDGRLLARFRATTLQAAATSVSPPGSRPS
ncbi:MAG TPA: EamA family transporter [Candidatus Polarisedimenticolia bacterium]|nr:EamA family transporter [Candidatus Polarisedimenticolia bacterium]